MARRSSLCAALGLALFAGVCDPGDVEIVPEVARTFSFEQGLEGWNPAGTDLFDPPVTWSIETTHDVSYDGTGSARFFLDNLNDQAKIWLSRSFPLGNGRAYEIEVRYRLGTSDFGDVNLWGVITGVHTRAPGAVGDLTFRGNTGNGATTDSGLVWVEREYSFDLVPEVDQSEVWVALGFWGTWETARTYYLDDLSVTVWRR